jgi:hypothetical protein
MILSDYRGFGTPSPTTGVDCPTGDVAAWCDCMWPGSVNPSANTACKSAPFGSATPDPWTDLGAAARGLPNVSSTATVGLLASLFGSPAAPGRPASSFSLSSLPTMILVGGGAITLLGLGFYLYKRKKASPRIAGYRRRKRR